MLSAAQAGKREDFGRDEGDLVGGVEGVGLGVGEVVDGVGAEEDIARVAKAVEWI